MVMPVTRQRFPVPVLANCATPVSTYGLPHLDLDMAVPALTAFLRQAEGPVILHSVPRSGPFWDAITAAAGHVAVLGQWQRAGLKLEGSFETWFETNFERKRRTRLSELGRFDTVSLKAGDDAGPWVADFLALEAASWKGRRGTAIIANPIAAATLGEACEGLSRSGKLRFWKLTLDGRTIAILFAVVEGDSAWLGKIAHDDAYARFSPGVLQILHATEELFAEGTIAHADSCAIPDHPMIDHLWRGRIAVADVMLASASYGAWRFAAVAAAERLRRTLRALARDLFHKLTGRHRS
jgi:CelD/BcsL family acetyltransferase involved in cellulose biosynthesis